MEQKEGKFVFEDENGNKKELDIFFTYHSDTFNKDYIVFIDPDDEDNLIAARYDENNNIYDIESDEEYDELDEVIEAYQSQEEIPVIEEEK